MVDVGVSDSNPSLSDDTEYIFEAGTHTVIRDFNTDGHDNVTLTLHPDAILDVYTDLSGWTASGTANVWKYEGFTRTIAKKGSSQTGWRADYTIGLYTTEDNDAFQPFKHLDEDVDLSTTLGNLAENQWYIDEDANGANDHDLYMYSTVDPDTLLRVVVTASTESFADGDGTNITIRRQPNTGLPWTHMPTLRGYGARAQTGVVTGGTGSANWLVDGIRFIYNYGVGVRLRGNDSVLKSCEILYQSQLGFGLGPDSFGGTGFVAKHLEIGYCNTANFVNGWESGGWKNVFSIGTVMYDIDSHHNEGRGGWDDVDNIDHFVFRCRFRHNASAGYNTELGFGAHIANCWFFDNGAGGQAESWDRDAAIYIQNSSYGEVHNNIIVQSADVVHGDGITFVQQDRGTTLATTSLISGDERSCLYNRVHHNTIYRATSSSDSQIIEMQADYDAVSFTSSNMILDYNTYHILSSDSTNKYVYESSAFGPNASDLNSAGFEVNASETEHASSATFPDWTDPEGNSWAWDEMPDWFSIDGSNWEALSYKQKVMYIPTLFALWGMDDASANEPNITDYGPWGMDAVNDSDVGGGAYATYEVSGIGDGGQAMAYDGTNEDYANIYDANMASLNLSRESRTVALWVKTDEDYTSSATFFALGASSSNDLLNIRVSATDVVRFEWAIDGVSNTQNYSTSSNDWEHYSVRHSKTRNERSLDHNGVSFYSNTALTETGWTAPVYSTARGRLNAATASGSIFQAGDNTYYMVGMWNVYLPDYIMENIVAQYNQHPIVSAIADVDVVEDSAITPIQVDASENNSADTLSYTMYGQPSGLSIDSSGEITGTPTASGVYPIEVQVADDGAPNRTTTVYFEMTVGQVVVPDFVASTVVVHSPSVSTGLATITPDFISSTAVVHEPSVSVGSGEQTLVPDYIVPTTAVYEPSVSTGEVTILPDFIMPTAVVYRPRIVGGEQTTTAISTLMSGLSAYPAMTGNTNTILVTGSNQYPEGVNMALDVTLVESATKAFNVTEDTAVGLVGEAEGRFTQAQVDGSVGAMIGIEGQDILFLINGDDPSSDVDNFIGLRKKHGEEPWLLFKNENLDNLRVIAAAGTSRLTVVLLQEI